MLKQFHNIWKNATVHKFQIVLLRRFNTSPATVQVHFSQLYSLNHIKSNCHLPISARNSCKNPNGRRCISSSTVKYTNLNRSENVASKYKAMEANLKWRADPVIVTLDTPQFKSILRKNILDLVSLFQKYNYEIRIAGGAVR